MMKSEAKRRADEKYRLAHPEKAREHARRYREANREKVLESQRRSKLKINYGISLEDYDRILAEQGGVCALCKTDDPGRAYFSVDHDHITLVVRGLLCHNCNVGLGMFKDNVDALRAAVAYLDGDEG